MRSAEADNAIPRASAASPLGGGFRRAPVPRSPATPQPRLPTISIPKGRRARRPGSSPDQEDDLDRQAPRLKAVAGGRGGRTPRRRRRSRLGSMEAGGRSCAACRLQGEPDRGGAPWRRRGSEAMAEAALSGSGKRAGAAVRPARRERRRARRPTPVFIANGMACWKRSRSAGRSCAPACSVRRTITAWRKPSDRARSDSGWDDHAIDVMYACRATGCFECAGRDCAGDAVDGIVQRSRRQSRTVCADDACPVARAAPGTFRFAAAFRCMYRRPIVSADAGGAIVKGSNPWMDAAIAPVTTRRRMATLAIRASRS